MTVRHTIFSYTIGIFHNIRLHFLRMHSEHFLVPLFFFSNNLPSPFLVRFGENENCPMLFKNPNIILLLMKMFTVKTRYHCRRRPQHRITNRCTAETIFKFRYVISRVPKGRRGFNSPDVHKNRLLCRVYVSNEEFGT